MAYRPRRYGRLAGYLLIAITGAAAMLWPPPSVTHATSVPLTFVWAWFLVVGGIASASGAATDLWLGEYVGLWPLIVATAVFGISSLATGHWYTVAGGCFLLAVASWLWARWQDVAVLRREATRLAQNRQ